ncbi:hypothetical protein BYT27DRAFT_7219583 [Phlegmacium glaucopus]|nr:hypothetical protein BYT27DRAFT_7219583 [Phlegmacium glaucopus]
MTQATWAASDLRRSQMSPGIILQQYRLPGVAKPTRPELHLGTCMPVTQQGKYYIVTYCTHREFAGILKQYWLSGMAKPTRADPCLWIILQQYRLSGVAKPTHAELHIGTGMPVTQEQARAGSDLSRSYMSGLGCTIQLLAIGPGSHHRDPDFGLLPRQAAVIPSIG